MNEFSFCVLYSLQDKLDADLSKDKLLYFLNGNFFVILPTLKKNMKMRKNNTLVNETFKVHAIKQK